VSVQFNSVQLHRSVGALTQQPLISLRQLHQLRLLRTILAFVAYFLARAMRHYWMQTALYTSCMLWPHRFIQFRGQDVVTYFMKNRHVCGLKVVVV